jgi:hypothetical protein
MAIQKAEGKLLSLLETTLSHEDETLRYGATDHQDERYKINALLAFAADNP